MCSRNNYLVITLIVTNYLSFWMEKALSENHFVKALVAHHLGILCERTELALGYNMAWFYIRFLFLITLPLIFFKYFILSIYLFIFILAASGLSCSTLDLRCCMWDLSLLRKGSLL